MRAGVASMEDGTMRKILRLSLSVLLVAGFGAFAEVSAEDQQYCVACWVEDGEMQCLKGQTQGSTSCSTCGGSCALV